LWTMYNERMEPLLYQGKRSIKIALEKAAWWKFVQDEVKHSIYYIIEHIDKLGTDFRDAYLATFKYYHVHRIIKGESKTGQKGVFGKISEEAYQSAIVPTKLLLNLDDWTMPNDADVQACMFLCQHVDILEGLGILGAEPKHNSNDVFKNILKSKKDKPADGSPGFIL
jgi:hypothetical protein